MNKIYAADLYTNVATGAVVEVVSVNGETGKAEIVSVAPSGAKSNRRTIAVSSFRSGVNSAKGVPYRTGYVRSDLLAPAAAPVVHTKESVMDISEPDFSAMTNEELAHYMDVTQAKKNAFESLFESAKEEWRSRHKDASTQVFGDTAVNTALASTFSADKAKRMLTDRQYAAICVTKPDAKLARKVLDENSSLYRSLLTPSKPRITVRRATDEDYEAARLSQVRTDLATFQEGDVFDGKAPF